MGDIVDLNHRRSRENADAMREHQAIADRVSTTLAALGADVVAHVAQRLAADLAERARRPGERNAETNMILADVARGIGELVRRIPAVPSPRRGA